MISVILYGRNDNYGYNLHKRAALSFNCIAEVLTDPSDEILFVDYNTPDDFPTFPEAIQDTLTVRAREKLRIFRVRPNVHDRHKSKTRLLALEPIARNVAVRRSSPLNPWILSTNTDMILVPHGTTSLSEIVRGLAPGFYHAPRMEIPEVLWESLNRYDAANIIDTVRDWGTSLHLNEIVLGSSSIRYDGPGDFQLFLRSDLFDNHGFNEEMLLGWHVDSNVAARMLLKYRKVGDLGTRLYGYHCDHTRQVTPAHSHNRVQNDPIRFVSEIERPDIPGQRETWGCAGDAIEDLRLHADAAGVYVRALRETIGDPLTMPLRAEYRTETYNQVDYDPKHVLPFLTDMFASMPRICSVGWYGARSDTLRLFALAWSKLQFTGRILLADDPLRREADAISAIPDSEVLDQADAFIFDFGGLRPSGRGQARYDLWLRRNFRKVVQRERARLAAGASPRRVICLNAINNDYEHLVCGSIAAAATPFATRMRHGFVLPLATSDWQPLLLAGEAGVRIGTSIGAKPGAIGLLTYGPYKRLDSGTHIVTITFEELYPESTYDEARCLFVEFRSRSELIGMFAFKRSDLEVAEHSFSLAVPENQDNGFDAVECRIVLLHPSAVVVRGLTVEPSADSDVQLKIPAALTLSDLFDADNWLPFLRPWRHGRMDEVGITARPGPPGMMIFGPHWALPTGNYEMTARIQPTKFWGRKSVFSTEIYADDTLLAKAEAQIGSLPYDKGSTTSLLRVPFEIDDLERRPVNFRILSSWLGGFRIRTLSLKHLVDGPKDLLPFFLTGDAGQRVNGLLQNVEYRIGCIAYTPAMALRGGSYKVSYLVNIRAKSSAVREDVTVVIVAKEGSKIIAADRIKIAGPKEHRDLVFNLSTAPNQFHRLEFSVWAVAPIRASIEYFLLDRPGASIPISSCVLDDLPAIIRKVRGSSGDGLSRLRTLAKQSRLVTRIYKRIYRM